ncbi:hypothetical protein FVEN_g9132 [Fusarium venenatum]|uniref:Uncharacterized protein n=1 Tax=Fusarium venenatum TaxID=56646 RepID=A0A2L2TUE2_9HYPO|nr:uncharacterized protein FVRRES_00337 [Fusarium venenatum]KAG8352860.1 hypothetical protein FVEN_g9132 [Fusarium venenatum]KAH7006411.1 hypothetical protein EDB82DRAFT_473076 [Fusarium venenatum]CEI63825.1 unnamed protein product [Fusarium venenatum]
MSAQSGSAASAAKTNNNEIRTGEETNGCREEETRGEMTNEEKEEERYKQLQLDLQRRLKQKVAEFKAKPKDMDKKAKSERDVKRRLEAKQMWMAQTKTYLLSVDEMRNQLQQECGMAFINAMNYSLEPMARERFEDGEMTQSGSTATTAEKNNIDSCTRKETGIHHGKKNRAKVSEEMRKSVVEMLERKDWKRVLDKLDDMCKKESYGGMTAISPVRSWKQRLSLNQKE